MLPSPGGPAAKSFLWAPSFSSEQDGQLSGLLRVCHVYVTHCGAPHPHGAPSSRYSGGQCRRRPRRLQGQVPGSRTWLLECSGLCGVLSFHEFHKLLLLPFFDLYFKTI